MTKAEDALLAEVKSARSGRKLVPTRGEERGVELEAAYRIQERLANGQQVKGYKLGLLSPAKQSQMGIDHPTYGRIYPHMLKEGSISLADFMQPRVEPEVAVLLAKGIAADDTPGKIAAAIGGYFLGLDVLDTVWQGYKFSAAEVVADNTSGGGFVLGTRLHSVPPTGALRLFINGRLAAEGQVQVLGNPVDRLAFLAKQVGGLDAGQVVFLGSPAAATPAQKGLVEVVSDDDTLMVKVED